MQTRVLPRISRCACCLLDLRGERGLARQHEGVRELHEKSEAQRHEDVLQERVLVAEGTEDVAQAVEHVAPVLAAGHGGISEAGLVRLEAARLIGHVDDVVVDHAADCPSQRQDPREGLEGPDDVVTGNQEAREDEGEEPHLHEVHHPQQRILGQHAEHLRQRLPRVHVRGEEENHQSEVGRVVVADAVGRNSQREDSKQEHDRQLRGDGNDSLRRRHIRSFGLVEGAAHLLDRVRDHVREGVDQAVLDLSSDGFELRVVSIHRDHRHVRGDSDEPDREEHLVHDLVLVAVATGDVDDGEENIREQEDEAAAEVQRWVAQGEQRVAAHHDLGLPWGKQRGTMSRFAISKQHLGRECSEVFVVGLEALQRRAVGVSGFLLLPCIQNLVNILLARKVRVDKVQVEISGIRVRRNLVSDAPKPVPCTPGQSQHLSTASSARQKDASKATSTGWINAYQLMASCASPM
eukprot:scaffold1254_cov251-Pinguiococcus_pyrenoidosus.AAC.19